MCAFPKVIPLSGYVNGSFDTLLASKKSMSTWTKVVNSPYTNPKIRSLFKEFGYDLCPTGADSSHQNGPDKCAHQTIDNGLRTLLNGANLDARFWPYAYHYYLRIKNYLPGKEGSLSAYSRIHD
jgi:hypothetical protein